MLGANPAPNKVSQSYWIFLLLLLLILVQPNTAESQEWKKAERGSRANHCRPSAIQQQGNRHFRECSHLEDCQASRHRYKFIRRAAQCFCDKTTQAGIQLVARVDNQRNRTESSEEPWAFLDPSQSCQLSRHSANLRPAWKPEGCGRRSQVLSLAKDFDSKGIDWIRQDIEA